MNILNKIRSSFSRANILGEYLKNYRLVNNVASLSMISPKNLHKHRILNCPICNSNDFYPLIKIPVGYPDGIEGHSFLYFDYDSVDLEHFSPSRSILDRTLGFKLSVPWNFCNKCKNGSLAVEMSQAHLDVYYSKYFQRIHTVHPLRSKTKQVHAEYLCGFLDNNSQVLEIGAADGFAAEHVASKGHKVSVYEASPNYQERLKSIHNISVVSDVASLEKESLDVIYSHHVLEHIASPIKYLKNLRRLLKPSGLLFLQVPDLELQLVKYHQVRRKSIYAIFNPVTMFEEKIDYDFWSTKKSYGWLDVLVDGHVSAFTSQGLGYVLSESGFEVIQLVQTTADKVQLDPKQYTWAIDLSTGNTPDAVSVLARN